MIARTPAAQHALAVGIMGLGLIVALIRGCSSRNLLLDTGDLVTTISFLAFVAAAAWCLFKRGYARLASAILAMTALFTIILLILLEIALLATHGQPFVDALLARADAVIAPWLDWPALALWFSRHPITARLCEWVYHSLAWQPFLLIAVFCGSRRPQESWRFIGMWALSLMICAMVFALYPGVGAYAFHHVNASLVSATSATVSSDQLRLLAKLRAPSLTMIGNDCLGGMITFPSFHAAASVLLARGYWRIRGLRWPFAALNLTMLAAAIPMGGHYVADLLAGVAVAAFAIAVFDSPPLRLDALARRAAQYGKLRAGDLLSAR
ncbi:MAG: phosphatase PAP2 family protein [Candidatus Sphingomonas colombiensis]|nr:phosphatase PAP2 family protein [Sphingomonas sp.]WEK44538.1 MAG: phosphatase PAP2 family protein [Sphingomonas sp.]